MPTGRAGPLVIELGTGTAIVGGQRIEIPPGEFELLAALAAHPGEAVSSKDLLEELWPGDSVTTEQDLRSRVYRLRRRIGDHGRDQKIVANRPGFGYLIDLPPGAIEVVSRTDAITDQPESDVIILDGRPDESDATTVEHDLPAYDAPPAGVASETPFPIHQGRAPRTRLIRPVVVGVAALIASVLLAGSWLAGSWLSQRRSSVTQPPIDEGGQADAADTARKGADAVAQSKDKRPRSGRARLGSGGAGPEQTATEGGSVATQVNPDRDAQPGSSEDPAPETIPRPDARLFHLFDPDTGEHFMTTDSSAANQKQAAGHTSTMEGRVFETRSQGTIAINLGGSTAYIYRDAGSAPQSVDVAPLYRLTKSTDAFFTSSSSQANQAEAQGWTRSLAGYVGI